MRWEVAPDNLTNHFADREVSKSFDCLGALKMAKNKICRLREKPMTKKQWVY